MKEKVFLISLALFLSLGIFASVTQIFAQDGINDSDTTVQPGSGAIIDEATPGVTVAEDVFNPLWLLPLIAIPVLVYLIWMKKRYGDSDISEHEFAGIKGGRAQEEIETRRDRDEEL